MINNEELKSLCEYFANKEVPKELENLMKKLNLLRQMNACQEQLDKLIKEK